MQIDTAVRIAVLVPLRLQPEQQRDRHLTAFYNHIRQHYDVFSEADATGKTKSTIAVVVGQQSWDGHKFSRGRCLNALAVIAKTWYPNATRFVLHDVDLLPDEVCIAAFRAPLPCDGLGVLALNGYGEYKTLRGYIGGICVLSVATFFGANGFDQRFEGWGGEDDALRAAVVRYARATKSEPITIEDAICKHPAGAHVFDMEACRAHCDRASGNAAWKMDKADKRRVCGLAEAEQYAMHGVNSACFHVDDVFRWKGELRPHTLEDAGDHYLAGHAAAVGETRECVTSPTVCVNFAVVTFSLYVALPAPWSMKMSRSTGWPYYFNKTTGVCAYELPEGTVVDRAPPPANAIKLCPASPHRVVTHPISDKDRAADAASTVGVPCDASCVEEPVDLPCVHSADVSLSKKRTRE
jgi:hypothetical protein